MGRPLVEKNFPWSFLGRRIREARMARGLTQTEMAERLGMASQGSFQKIESGRNAPSLLVLVKLMRLLELSPDDLLSNLPSPGELEDALEPTEQPPPLPPAPPPGRIQVTHPAGYELPETDEPAEDDDDGPDDPGPTRAPKRTSLPAPSKRHHHR